MSMHALASHNSTTGEVEIRSVYGKHRVLYSAHDALFVGREGIRRFHMLTEAIRKAEADAFEAAVDRAAMAAHDAALAVRSQAVAR